MDNDPLDLLRERWLVRLYWLVMVAILAATIALAALAEEALWIAGPSYLVGMFFGFFTIRVLAGKWY